MAPGGSFAGGGVWGLPWQFHGIIGNYGAKLPWQRFTVNRLSNRRQRPRSPHLSRTHEEAVPFYMTGGAVPMAAGRNPRTYRVGRRTSLPWQDVSPKERAALRTTLSSAHRKEKDDDDPIKRPARFRAEGIGRLGLRLHRCAPGPAA